MPVESFSYIDSLNPSNPSASDGIVQGDDHIRGIKAALKSTFPNITEAVAATAAQVNQLASGSMAVAVGSYGAPSIKTVGKTTLGFYRSAAGVWTFVDGRLLGNGTVPAGHVSNFFHDLGLAGTRPTAKP